MRVLLLNDGDFGDADNVTFPVEAEALRLTGGGCFKISCDELRRVGFVGFDHQPEWHFRNGTEAVLAPSDVKLEIDPPVKQGGAPCIREMCCNQFGERDEMQSIINSLQADVIKLEDEMTKAVFILQSDVDTKVEDALEVLRA